LQRSDGLLVQFKTIDEQSDDAKEDLAIQIYNEMEKISSRQEYLSMRKTELVLELQKVEKEWNQVNYELETRKKLMKKLSKRP